MKKVVCHNELHPVYLTAKMMCDDLESALVIPKWHKRNEDSKKFMEAAEKIAAMEA